MIRKLDHAKVPITTMNITPTRAAMGTTSISGERNKMYASSITAATIPDALPRPPDSTLIID